VFVKPWELLGQTRAPDGADLSLTLRSGEYVILANGKSLMSSRMHGSEEAMAELACERARTLEHPCVFIGGLGMGYALRATLDLLPPGGSVVVAELSPAVLEWNRGPLGPLAHQPLRDRRVQIELADGAAALRSSSNRFDAILLDVDNGPNALTTRGNAWFYGDAGIAAAHAALTPNGSLAVWSAWEDRKFEQVLRHGGFLVEVVRLRARLKKGGPRHTIFLGHRGARPSRGRRTQRI
jgi:spermidine synthase